MPILDKQGGKNWKFWIFCNFINPQTLINVQFIEYLQLVEHFVLSGSNDSKSEWILEFERVGLNSRILLTVHNLVVS